MGCDIHICTECKSDGVWHFGKVIHGIDRNYQLFTFLAGVRAGTWGVVMPILAGRRGLPNDASKKTVRWLEEDGAEHSLSFLSARELAESYGSMKAGPIVFNAFVDWREEGIRAWLLLPEATRGSPPSFGGEGNSPALIRVKWTVPLAEWIGAPIERILGALDGTDNSRIVFGFDN